MRHNKTTNPKRKTNNEKSNTIFKSIKNKCSVTVNLQENTN